MAVTASDGSFVITTASGNNLSLQIWVPGSNTPKQLTISIPAGTTVQLGQIDPSLLDLIDQVINGQPQSSDEIQQPDVEPLPPSPDADCIAALQTLESAISAQNTAWLTVQTSDQWLWQAAGTDSLLFATQLVGLTADVALAVAATATAGTALVTGALEVGTVATTMAAMVSVVSSVQGTVSNLQNPTTLLAMVDGWNSAVGILNSVHSVAVELIGALSGAEGTANIFQFGLLTLAIGSINGVISAVTSAISICTQTTSSLQGIYSGASQSTQAYQNYLSDVTDANIALQAYEDAVANNTGGNPGNGNNGTGNNGTGNTGNGNTGNDNTGNDNTGNDNTGNDNTGNDNTGNDNTGNDNTGNDNTGNDNTGNGNTGNGNTGDGGSDGDGNCPAPPRGTGDGDGSSSTSTNCPTVGTASQ